MHNKGIRRKIFGKSAAGSKLEFKVLAGVFADPRGQLHGADIAALAVVRAAFGDQNAVARFQILNSRSAAHGRL